MYENSSRLGYSENAIAQLLRDLLDLKRRVAAVEQQPWSGGGGGQGGDQATAGYFACTLSGALAHGGNVAGQTVWRMDGGARTNVTTNGKVYNDGPNASNDIASGKTAILASNADGSYTVTQVYCP